MMIERKENPYFYPLYPAPVRKELSANRQTVERDNGRTQYRKESSCRPTIIQIISNQTYVKKYHWNLNRL